MIRPIHIGIGRYFKPCPADSLRHSTKDTKEREGVNALMFIFPHELN